MNLSEMELDEYKTHPRVLEIRFILFFDTIEKEYGFQGALKFIESLCKSFNCNFMLLNGLINRRFEIKGKSKIKWRLWRQEVLFVAKVYGETVYKASKYYLGLDPHTIYSQSEIYDFGKYCNNEWLEKFDTRVTLCGQPSYRLEVVRFFEVIDNLKNILKKWQGDE